MTQRVIEILSPNFVPAQQIRSGMNWSAIFGNDKPVALEIGCGTGHFIIARARQQPAINFIAIDIYNKGCWKTCKKIDALQLPNIKVLRTEAAYLLETGFARQSLQSIYVNCPDPWPKKRHRKRRLFNQDFLQLVLMKLTPGGDFYFSTDVADYARDVASLLEGDLAFINQNTQAIVNHLPGYPSSKYMQRFLEQGQPIHYLHFQRGPDVPDPVRQKAASVEPRTGFRSRWPRARHE